MIIYWTILIILALSEMVNIYLGYTPNWTLIVAVVLFGVLGGVARRFMEKKDKTRL